VYNSSLREQKRAILTEDGSMTLFSVEFDEPYHSDRDGAFNESLQKHVNPAFRFKSHQKSLTILDICFGLGYNTLATLYYIKKHKLDTKVHIVSPEFDRGLIESLSSFEYPKEFEEFGEIIATLSRDFYYKDEQFEIEILIGDAREILPTLSHKFDIVYQDAFSPTHNPLLWTREYFATIASLMRDDGLLTTYSIASAVRMGLDESGFKLFIYKGEGIRESMVASFDILDLEFIDMELKKIRNKEARSMRDEEYLKYSL